MSYFFPVIDPEATGKNILRLRIERNLSVRELQDYFGFAEPNAIYHWQKGKTLPSVDNLFALSELFHVSMNEILVAQKNIEIREQQAAACCSNCFSVRIFGTEPSVNDDPGRVVQKEEQEFFKIGILRPGGIFAIADQGGQLLIAA